MARDRVLVLGLMGRYPIAGIGWQTLHYVIGLERLGFDVFYVEDSGAAPYDPRAVALGTDATQNVAFVRSAMQRTQAPEQWVYWDVLEDRYHGLDHDALLELYATCDQVWNLSGATRLRPEHRGARRRVYVQTDPGFEQVRLARGDAGIADAIDAHDVLFTYGENLSLGESALPAAGRLWHPTRPPVLLDAWEASPPAAGAPFSTIGSWTNSGKDATWNGRTYRWSKADGFRRVLSAPRRAAAPVRAALSPPHDLREEIKDSGWDFVDPYEVSTDLDLYRSFIHASCGEFTATKDVYVASHSGWFSDRSATYLASGRAVVTEDTGAPVPDDGPGLRTYRTSGEAVSGLKDVSADVAGHARGARVLAEEYFDAARVLGKMLETISP